MTGVGSINYIAKPVFLFSSTVAKVYYLMCLQATCFDIQIQIPYL